MNNKLIFIFYFSIITAVADAQKFPQEISANKIIETIDAYNASSLSEKLFIHFDKPYYSIGDTIWFKAYLLQTSTNIYSPVSGLLYLELITDSNKIVNFRGLYQIYTSWWWRNDF